ncbi:hypothetical protein GN958_ATG00334, partial [Phytophthora infestans]
QYPSAEYNNLLSHVRQKYPDVKAIMAITVSGVDMVTNSQMLYCSIDFTTSYNLPSSFPRALQCIKYAGLPTTEVEQIIISVLPANFGNVFDGWTFHSEHYNALFAPPLQEVEGRGADMHLAFLRSILGIYRSLCCLSLMTIDLQMSASPLYGVFHSLSDYEPLFSKVNNMMRKLRCLNATGKHQKPLLALSPTQRHPLVQYICHDPAFCCCEKNFFDTDDDMIAMLMPSRHARDLFDTLGDRFACLLDYPGADVAITHDAEFEAACVAIRLGESETLSAGRRRLLRPGQSSAPDTVVTEPVTVTRQFRKGTPEAEGGVSEPYHLPSTAIHSSYIELHGDIFPSSQACHLITIGFKKCTRDAGVYWKNGDHYIIFLTVYVDDMLIAADTNDILMVVEALSEKVKQKDLG